MKAFVITIQDVPQSVAAASRCINSGKQFGVEVFNHPAYIPKDNPEAICKKEGINYSKFIGNKFSRFENCVAAFLSHRSVWMKAIELNEDVLVLEHDAVFTAPLQKYKFDYLLSIGHPSYGKYVKKAEFGIYPLFSKGGRRPYLPGAHAYIVKPKAVPLLLAKAKQQAEPTDIFLNRGNFPWIQECYPWPVKADDSVSTIQTIVGCKAKHNFEKGIEII